MRATDVENAACLCESRPFTAGDQRAADPGPRAHSEQLPKALEGLPRGGGGQLPARLLRGHGHVPRRQVRRKRRRVRGPARTPPPRCLQGRGDERRRDDGAAPARKNQGGRQQVRRVRNTSAGRENVLTALPPGRRRARPRRRRRHPTRTTGRTAASDAAAARSRGRRERPRPRCSKGAATSARDDGRGASSTRTTGRTAAPHESASTCAGRRERPRPLPRGATSAGARRRRGASSLEPRGGRQQVRQRQHACAGQENGSHRGAGRFLRVFGDERRRDDGVAPAYKNYGADGSKSDEQHAGRRERPRPRCLQGARRASPR